MTARATPQQSFSRALAPDLARGMMLLLIALANLPVLLWTPTTRGPQTTIYTQHGDSAADALWYGISLVFIDMRALPLFALLFAYGMVQFARAQEVKSTPYPLFRTRLLRRHLAMIVLGAAHAALLFPGDILGFYGLVGLLLVTALFRSNDRIVALVRTILVWISVAFSAVLILLGTLVALVPGMEVGGVGATDVTLPLGETWLGGMPSRVLTWLATTVSSLALLPLIAVMLTGWLWARRGWLDQPENHLPALRRTAWICLPIGWLGGLVMVLHAFGVFWRPELDWALSGWQLVTGMFGGIGYAALFGLIAARVRHRPGRVTGAVSAVGKRSLSAYLWQSLLMVPLVAPWGFNLGGTLGSAGAAGVAVLIWLASLVWCAALEKVGRRGPAEVLLRRMTYGRPA